MLTALQKRGNSRDHIETSFDLCNMACCLILFVHSKHIDICMNLLDVMLMLLKLQYLGLLMHGQFKYLIPSPSFDALDPYSRFSKIIENIQTSCCYSSAVIHGVT